MYFKKKIYTDDGYALKINNSFRSQTNVNFMQRVIIDHYGLSMINAFTIEIRFKLEIFGGTYPHLFSIQRQSGGSQGPNIRFNNSSTLLLGWNDAGLSNRNLSRVGSVYATNHIVLVFHKNNRMSFYLNGSKTENTANATIGGQGLTRFELFRGIDSNNYNTYGKAIGFRLFDEYAASDVEVTALYGGVVNRMLEVPSAMQSSLKREHIFNQKNGRTIVDSSGNGKSAILGAGFSDIDIIQNGNAWQTI